MFILRINLPPNNIAFNIAVKDDTNEFQEILLKGAFTQAIADWQIIDLIVVKFACSDRLEMLLMAVPFQKWHVAKKQYGDCQ